MGRTLETSGQKAFSSLQCPFDVDATAPAAPQTPEQILKEVDGAVGGAGAGGGGGGAWWGSLFGGRGGA